MQIKKGADLIMICRQKNLPLHQVMLEYESAKSGKTQGEIKELMRINLQVMKDSVYQGLDQEQDMKGKIIGDKLVNSIVAAKLPACVRL